MSENLDQVDANDEPTPTSAQDVTDHDMGDDGEKKPSKWRGSQVLIGLIGLGLAGTYFMYVKTGPASASAMPATAAHKSVNDFLTAGPANIKTMEKMLKNTEKVVQQFLAYPAVTQVALADLKTNPFRQTAVKAKADGVDENVVAKQREAEKQAALSAVRTLNLQSVLVSDKNRSCMINNAMYLEGQQVDTFAIERITAASVVVRRGAYRFELQMNR